LEEGVKGINKQERDSGVVLPTNGSQEKKRERQVEKARKGSSEKRRYKLDSN